MKIKGIIKISLSFIVSFAILNGICVFYYNIPVHEQAEHAATDHIWKKNTFFSRGTEGFASGVTDGNGYNNLSVIPEGEIDILLMGSSHLEAFNVSQEESLVSQLNKLFDDNGVDMKGYNIGISSHAFTRCLFNLEDALDQFKPNKYVVIEASSIFPDYDKLCKVADGSFERLKQTENPLLIFLQKIPLIRRLYAQISSLNLFEDTAEGTTVAPEKKEPADAQYQSVFNEVLEKAGKTAQANSVKLIVLYHPTLYVDSTGCVYRNVTDEELAMFSALCEDNDLEFIDMYSSFTEYYNLFHRLPHGFSNTAVGKGHLNRYGHMLMAQELFEKIVQLENR